MALTKIHGRQIKDLTIELGKLVEGAELIQRDGSVAFTGDVDLGSNKLLNVADGTVATDGVNKGQLDSAIAGLASGLEYKGTFDASAGVFPSDITTGDFYKVSIAGTVDGVELAIGDMIIANNTKAGVTAAADWDKVDNTESVTSVAGKTGAVTLDVADITGLQTALDNKLDDSQLDIDGTLAANSDDRIASQKAVKTYIDNAVSAVDSAAEISYDNTTSGLAATDVQAALDEIDAVVDGLSANGGQNGLIVNNEVPSGTIDGTNADFTVANTPLSGSVCLYLNGVRLDNGASDDFTVAGTTVTFNEAPYAGDTILCDYRK